MGNILNELLDKYRVNRDFQSEIRNGYRNPIQNVLGTLYDVGVRFMYGGSLAKGTANINSCDIDLLCYVDFDSNMTLKEIYNITAKQLIDTKYVTNIKNSAIEVTGKLGEAEWDYTVDVVPGRYISDTSKDVNLWNNRQQKTMKTNPEVQIEKVKESESKEVIRLIKLYRDFNSFKFKSFFLEIFAIDVVEDDFNEGDDITDKLMHFCNHYNDIGIKTIHDPANSNNNIMDIHSNTDFEIIRDKINILRKALLTDDYDTIKKCFLGQVYNEEDSYKNTAVKHSNLIDFKNLPVTSNAFYIEGSYTYNENVSNKIYDDTVLGIGITLKFTAFVPNSYNVSSLKWIICNSGYEARKDNTLRGNKYEECNEPVSILPNGKRFFRTESTKYYGNHYAQAIMKTTTGKILCSNIITVKVRF